MFSTDSSGWLGWLVSLFYTRIEQRGLLANLQSIFCTLLCPIYSGELLDTEANTQLTALKMHLENASGSKSIVLTSGFLFFFHNHQVKEERGRGLSSFGTAGRHRHPFQTKPGGGLNSFSVFFTQKESANALNCGACFKSLHMNLCEDSQLELLL